MCTCQIWSYSITADVRMGVNFASCLDYDFVVNSFSFPGDGWQYALYHMSSNGSDDSTCGVTMDTACKTLEHVLHLYYNSPYPPKVGLEIITSKSLTIDKHLMVRFKECIWILYLILIMIQTP